MDKTQRAKHLLKEGWRWEEIANELDSDLDTLYNQTQRDRRTPCSVCGGYFGHIKKKFPYCGFSCWAAKQTNGMSWNELKIQYEYVHK